MIATPFLCIGTPAYKKTPLIYQVTNDLDEHLNSSEIIFYVSDDSPDSSLQNALDNRVRYERNGMGNAIQNWNKVIQFAESSRWCWLLHHDEYVNNVQEVYDECLKADAERADIIIFDVIVNSDSRSRRLSRKFMKRLVVKFPSILFISNLIGSPSAVCVRSEVYAKYNTKLTWLVDVENYYRLLTQSDNAVYFSKLCVISVEDSKKSITAGLTNIKDIHLSEIDQLSLHFYKAKLIKFCTKMKYQLKKCLS